MAATIEWANTNRRQWAFSLSNAGATYTQFRGDLARLNEINWPAVEARNFTAREIKEGKQAEFLLHGYFPWQLVSRIGVISRQIAQQAHNALGSASHRPPIEITSDWYF